MRRARQLSQGTHARRAIGALLCAALALAAAPARAGEKDTDALVAVAESMNDFVEGKNDDAQKKLDDALKACGGAACEANTRAQLLVSIGIVAGAGKKDTAKALASFEAALREDPKVVPDRQFMTKDLNKVFAEAKANIKKNGTGPAPTRPAPSKQQMETVAAAQAQLAQKNWSDCMGTLAAGSEFAAAKLLLAQCEDAGGLIMEATADAKLAVKFADEEINADVRRRADELLTRLGNDTPSIVIVVPKNIDEIEVKIDGVVVPKDKADKPIPRNPGKVTIEVTGKKGPYPYTFKSTETFDRGERITVNATDDNKNNSAVLQCILNARTPSDVNTCIETGGKGRGLTIRGGLEIASYNDSTNVDVLSPTLFLSAENPTAGWRVGGSYTVDVVTNASPDIVATATRRFDEVRNAGTLAAEVKLGPARVGLDGGVSIEPDYFARTVGVSVSADLLNKQLTPTLSYHLSFDSLSRAHTPNDVFSRSILTHSIDAGASIIASPSTMLVVGFTAELENGDTSKPYRHIPMFSAEVAPQIPRGATPALVSQVRLAPAPFEQLPDNRQRFALLGRWAHRFEKSTLRADERVYLDSWSLKASTTDARFLVDLSKTLRAGPHLRFNVQSPVSFWERAYVAKETPDGWQLPRYRAGDRELGPLFGVTLGGGLRWALSDIFAVNLQVEGVYTQFLNDIYVYDRWGLFTATTIEVGVE
jgi:Protein of unknown function (DUF3570)